MKILITTETYYPTVNGVVRSLLNLKDYLNNQGHEVKVLTLSNTLSSYKSDDTYYIGSLSANRIYPEARIYNILAKTYLREIMKWEPDIIHTQNEFSTFAMAKMLSKAVKAPLIHTYHTVYEDYTHYFTSNKRAGVKMVALASKKIADMCNYIIAPTSKTAGILESYQIKKEKIKVIPTGVIIPDYYEDDLRDELGLPKDKNILLYLGRLGEEKNIEEVIDFYGKLDDDNTVLTIVGGGPYIDTLMRHADTSGKDVNFVGMVKPDEVNKYYQAADIFVTSSTSETQGLTYYEALSNGTIVVARDDESLEGVVFGGFNGYRYKDFDEFSIYIEKILSNDDFRTYLSTNARTYAVENFSVESFGQKCEKLYELAISEYKYESSFIHKRL